MGLLKAGLGAAGGVMADQWKEFIYCESMPADVLACKGSKRTGGRSSNTRGEDNVISNGSVIAVNDGQGMLVVQNGKIIEVALEPGEFVFDTGSEPSVFSGNLAIPSRRPSPISAAALPLAATRARTSASTSSTPRRSSATSTAPPRPCPSACR